MKNKKLYSSIFEIWRRWFYAFCAFFVLVIYLLSIKPLLNNYDELTLLKNKMTLLETAPEEMKEMMKSNASMDSLLGISGSKSTNSNALFEIVSKLAFKYKLNLIDFPKAQITIEEDFITELNTLVFEGSFIDINSLVYELENTLHLGTVISVHYIKVKDFRQQKKKLQAKIYFQILKNK